MRAHADVLKNIRKYRNNFTVEYNRDWEDPGCRFSVCQPVPVMQLVDEDLGLWLSKEQPYPVLRVPQASEIDARWIRQLEMARWTASDIAKHHMDKLKRTRREAMNNAVDWAGDVGYWHFKRSINDINFSQVQAKDPTRTFKTIEDICGKEVL